MDNDPAAADRSPSAPAAGATLPAAGTDPARTRAPTRLRDAVRQNLLVLLSLAVALFGLGYNTWRNETTEGQRNIRDAGFIVLRALGELQELADARFYGGRKNETNRIAIWGRVVLIRDIAELVSDQSKQRADALYATWSEQAQAFDAGDPEAEKRFADATRQARAQVLTDLRALR